MRVEALRGQSDSPRVGGHCLGGVAFLQVTSPASHQPVKRIAGAAERYQNNDSSRQQTENYPSQTLWHEKNLSSGTFLNRCQPVNIDAINLLSGTVWPRNFDFVGPADLAQADGDGQLGLGEITARGHHLAAQRLAASADFDPCANRVTIALATDQLESNPMMPQLLLVAQQQWRSAYLRQHDVQIPIAVNVAVGRASPDYRLEQILTTPGRRHRAEAAAAPLAGIPEQLRGLAVLLAVLDFAN